VPPSKGRGVQLAALMLRLFRFLAISSASAARASIGGMNGSGSGMTSYAGGSLDATSSFTSTLLGSSIPTGGSSSGVAGMPDDALLIKVLRATSGVLVASARAAPKVFGRHLSFTFTPAAIDEEAGFTTGLAIGGASPSVSFVSSVRMLLQNIETVQGSYPATLALLDIMTALGSSYDD
jgi:hypothetical protein